jgi:5-methylthioadenosine/S-adenosylhomocysteine deaminase
LEKADCIIKAGFVITMEEPGFLVADGAVAVAGGRIADAGPSAQILERYLSEKIIGGPMYALMPGFVNTHTHAPMVFMRGVADDLPLMEWLQKHIWPLEAKWLSPEFVADATALACLEMLKAGVTAYNDMYFYEYAAAPAIKKIGMRAVLGAGIVDFPTKVASNADEYISRAEEFINNIAGEELLTPSVAPHALYTCSPETLGKSARLAERYRVPLHLHLSETKWERDEVHRTSGKSPVNLLESVGALSEKTIAAHCVWLEDQEIEILAGRGVNISHCPESNLKLASGVAPVAKMLKAGLKVSFGTDGAASNNDLNVMGEMATAAKVQKTDSWDPTALDARTALRMATKWGADALGTGGGSIKKGAPADLVLLDIDKPHLTPMYNVFSQLVYAAQASDVDTVKTRP